MKMLLVLVFFSAGALAQDIPSFSQVTPGIYRGGRPSDDGMMMLKNLGVKTDINLQGGDVDFTTPEIVAFMRWWEPGETAANIDHEHGLADTLQMAFVPEPLNSLKPVTDDEDAEIERILSVMNDPTAQPVFIHCEHGKDRTGLLVALYEVRFLGKSIDEAHLEWVNSGHSGVGAHFTSGLDSYFYKKVAP